MDTGLSKEELDVLTNDAILMLRQPERHPEFYFMVETWMSKLLHPRKIHKFHEALKKDPIPEPFLQDVTDLLHDWLQTIPEEERQAFREQQLARNVVLGYN